MPLTYRMTSHLFGGVWSPSCAAYAMQKTALDNQDDFDTCAVTTELDNFYVDDCLFSTPDAHRGTMIVQQLDIHFVNLKPPLASNWHNCLPKVALG